MVETTLAAHHAIAPRAEVLVAVLALLTLSRPHEMAVTTLDAVDESAAVLAAISVHHVSIARDLVIVPVTSVASALVSVDLNSKAMAHCQKKRSQLLRDLRDVLHHEHVSRPGTPEPRHLVHLSGFMDRRQNLDCLSVVDPLVILQGCEVRLVDFVGSLLLGILQPFSVDLQLPDAFCDVISVVLSLLFHLNLTLCLFSKFAFVFTLFVEIWLLF